MAFSIDYHNASRIYRFSAQPRYMIVHSQTIATFAAIVGGKAQGSVNSRALIHKSI